MYRYAGPVSWELNQTFTPKRRKASDDDYMYEHLNGTPEAHALNTFSLNMSNRYM
jgi:hypothetical protein